MHKSAKPDSEKSKDVVGWKIDRKEALKLLGFILLCQAAGIIGAVFTTSSIPTWYALLNKPSFSPPNWFFGPVWTLLYAMMGASLYFAWETIRRNKLPIFPVYLFGTQLGLNTLWSILFFGLRSPGWALSEIVVLWFFIAWTIASFWKVSKRAALLLLSYLLWVSFASVLNYYIWALN